MFQVIRKSLGETGQSGRLSDADLMNYVRTAWADVIRECNSAGDNKIRVRYEVTMVADQAEYALPPTIEQFLSFEKWTTDTPPKRLWEIIPRHPLNPAGPGFTIEGTMLRLDPTWTTAHTMVVTYVPNGDVFPHEGTGLLLATTVKGEAAVDSSGSTVFTSTAADPGVVTAPLNGLVDDDPIRFTTTDTLPAPLLVDTTYYALIAAEDENVFTIEETIDGGELELTDTGTGVHSVSYYGDHLTGCTTMTVDSTPADSAPFDTRINAYAGYILRILSTTGEWHKLASGINVVQERVITAYDPTTYKATFAPSLDPLPSWTGTALDNGACVYELVPMHFHMCELAVSLWVVRFVADVIIGDLEKAQAANRQYATVIRGLRLKIGQMEQRVGRRMHRSIRGKR
jgi:hypothetical protein